MLETRYLVCYNEGRIRRTLLQTRTSALPDAPEGCISGARGVATPYTHLALRVL